jgi:hypothetical protein
VIEPPLDSNILEKPCTIVLFEDLSLVVAAARSCNDDTTVGGRNNNNNMTKKQQTNDRPPASSDDDSWVSHFQRRIPEEYGMSFAYLSFQHDDDDDNNKETNHEDVPTGSSSSSSSSSSSTGGIIADCVTSMKFSNGLSTISSDIVLITRGPVSSLCAQYYLESCSLLGLVMIDPILLSDDDDDDENNKNDSIIIRTGIVFFNDNDRKRFRNSSLLLEPNAVPMMVVLSQQDDVDWNRSSRMVARRHSSDVGRNGGLYGDVPIVDMMNEEDGDEKSTAPEYDRLMDIVNEWTDDIL